RAGRLAYLRLASAIGVAPLRIPVSLIVLTGAAWALMLHHASFSHDLKSKIQVEEGRDEEDGSAADRSALFAGFTATMAESDFLRPCIIGYSSSPSRCGLEHFRRWSSAGYPRFRRDPFCA